MMNIEFSIIVLLSCIIVGITIYTFLLRKLIKRAGMELLQAISDRQVVVDYLEKEMAKTNALELNDDDGFVKFLSESRDWAFSYIEQVQEQLKEFVDKVGPLMVYYDKYGRIQESESMNKVFDAYSELIKVLPETNNKQGENNE
jgi:adenylate kinase family enzyme